MPHQQPAACGNACAYDAQGGFSCGGGGRGARPAAGGPQQPQGLVFVGREGFAPAGGAGAPGFLERVCCTKDAPRCDAIEETIKRVACKAACDPSC